uniref:DUF148 domain-containing protein n=1 Tax=Strongyloides papillosus TaxID=174720 RepID=A0A0N5CDP8_STREA
MKFFLFLILISFFIIQLTAEENDVNKSTISQDDVTSTYFTIVVDTETTTKNPVTMVILLETTHSTNSSSLSDDDVVRQTTEVIPFNDTTTIFNNEKIEVISNDIPQFLVLSTDEAKKIYFEIQQNTNMKKYNIDKVTELWAQEQGDIINRLYKEHLKKIDEEKSSYKNYITTIINQLSEEAQEIHRKIEEIYSNNNITKKEEEKLITNLLASSNQSIVKELTTLNYKQ